jgi:phosphoribosylformylglycinamidine synthase
MLGIVENVDRDRMTPGFKEEGDLVYYMGAKRSGLGGSEYLREVHGLTTGDAPDIDLQFESELQNLLLSLIQSGRVNAVHDISDGGLAVTIAEMAIFSGLGAGLSVKEIEGSVYEVLYSEAQSGVVVTVKPDGKENFKKAMKATEIPYTNLGVVTNEDLVIDDDIIIPVKELSGVYETVLPEAMMQ